MKQATLRRRAKEAKLRRKAREATGVQVDPVNLYTDEKTGEKLAEADPGETRPDVWGVYWRLRDGRADWVSDHKKKPVAMKKARRLMRYIKEETGRKGTLVS